MLFKKNEPKILEVSINKKVHLLTLDNRWHELFRDNKSKKIKKFEQQLNELIKEQGQLNNDFKEYSSLKKKIMTDIVTNMSKAFEDDDNEAIKSMESNKNYISEINDKLEKIENRLFELPKEIDDINKSLLEASMSDCYQRMLEDKNRVGFLEEEINTLREKLKELVVEKNEKQEEYEQIYTYMHDLVGHDVIEQFDKLYLGS